MRHRLGNTFLVGLASTIWVVLCFVIFIGFDGELSFVALTLFGLYIYASAMLWKTVLDKRVAPLQLTFWLFHTNFLLLPALSQSLHRTFYWSSYNSYSQESLLYACLIIAIGLFAYGFGTRLGRLRIKRMDGGVRTVDFLSRSFELTWRPQLFLVVVFVGLVLMVLSLGTGFFMSSRMSNLSRVDSLSQLGLFLTLPRSLAYGGLLVSIILFVQKWRKGSGISFTITTILVVAIGLNVIINFPLSVARSWIFGLLISLIWIMGSLYNAKLRSVFVIGMTMFQFTVFPWFSQITRGKGQIEFNLESLRQYMHHGDFDAFQSMVNILLYVHESGFELGRNLISVALFFVPRTIWNKAEPLGMAAADFMGYVYTNLSAPIYGELYVDFGFLSLLFGMGIIGYGMTLLDGYYHRMVSAKRFGVGILLTSVMAGYLVILLRGSLLGVMPSFATLLVFLVIASWFSTRKIRREQRLNLHDS